MMMRWAGAVVGIALWLVGSMIAPARACGIGQPFTMLANGGAAVPYPLAAASASSPLGIFPQEVAAGGSVAFGELVPATLDPAAYDWRWDFGDGAGQVGVTAAHAFGHAGTFVVRLWLITHAPPQTAQMIDSAALTVVAQMPRDPPVVHAGASGAVVALGEALTYDARGSWAAGGGTLSYLWNFGDGQTATAPLVTHHFMQLGNGSVVLVAQDTRGARTVVSFAVRVVVPPPPPTLTVTAMPSGAASRLHLSAPPDATWAEVAWDFGDGATAVGIAADATHRYARPGSYAVTARVTTADGLTQTVTRTVVIAAAPLAPAAPGLASIALSGGALILGFLAVLLGWRCMGGRAAPRLASGPPAPSR